MEVAEVNTPSFLYIYFIDIEFLFLVYFFTISLLYIFDMFSFLHTINVFHCNVDE